MFELGDHVLVTLVSGYNPAKYIGRVSRLIGAEGCELEDCVMVKRCPRAKWGKLADGDSETRQASAEYYEHAGTIRFASCAYWQTWAGDLPTAAN